MHEVSWTDALGVGEREHIALVGGGGKTAALFALAEELSALGPTILTSTTKASAVPDGMPVIVWAADDDCEGALASIERTLRGGASRIALSAEPGRIRGVTPKALDAIWDAGVAAFIINEADGARMKPLKAPAPHEPVLGASTTITIVVIGADALGAPIDAEHAHRLTETLAATGAREGDSFTADHLCRIARTYASACNKQAPDSRLVVLVNKLDDTAALAATGMRACAEADRTIASGLVDGRRRVWRVG